LKVVVSLVIPLAFQEATTCVAELAEKLSALNGAAHPKLVKFTVTVPAVGTEKVSVVDSVPTTIVDCDTSRESAQACGAMARPVSAIGTSKPPLSDSRIVFVVFIALTLLTFRQFLLFRPRGQP
jgi:hypothetical protein